MPVQSFLYNFCGTRPLFAHWSKNAADFVKKLRVCRFTRSGNEHSRRGYSRDILMLAYIARISILKTGLSLPYSLNAEQKKITAPGVPSRASSQGVTAIVCRRSDE